MLVLSVLYFFSARNFRPGGATRGIEGGLPLDLIMHVGR